MARKCCIDFFCSAFISELPALTQCQNRLPLSAKTKTCARWQALAKADSTLRSSQAVPHPSTNRALCLTSEVERDPVHSTRYGRRRHYLRSMCICKLLFGPLVSVLSPIRVFMVQVYRFSFWCFFAAQVLFSLALLVRCS